MEHYEKEGKNIVYLDESGFEKETLRAYGYAQIGTRCVDSFDWQAKGRTNVIGACLAGFCWESVFLNSMSMRMFFMAGLFSAYCPPCRRIVWLWWITPLFINGRIVKRRLHRRGIFWSIYHLTRLTLIRLKKNGRRLKLFADKKDALLMSFSNSAFNDHFIGG